jgi:hypothetical protein
MTSSSPTVFPTVSTRRIRPINSTSGTTWRWPTTCAQTSRQRSRPTGAAWRSRITLSYWLPPATGCT